MALFENKKKETKKTVTKVAVTKKVEDVSGRLQNVLLAPWLSEKALISTEKGVYVFSVPPSVTKKQIALAVEKVYSVVPRKVTMVHLPGKVKNLRSRRGVGTRARRHKAYVHLKKGDTITVA